MMGWSGGRYGGTNVETKAALLRAIRESPDDDAPRLVYADWLEEHGDPDRAAFVRARVRLARLSPRDPARAPLGATAAALLKRHGRRWREGLPRWAATKARYERGFLETVTASIQQFVRGAAALFEAEPVATLEVGKQPWFK